MLRQAFLTVAALLCAHVAQAHGIAGNRFFPGTMTFDDPAVDDELQIYTINNRHYLDEDRFTVVRDQNFYGSFQRLLTDDLSFIANTGGIYRYGSGLSSRTGLDQTNVGFKQRVYLDELHETLVSASLTWGIGGSGSRAVGAGGPDTLSPAITFGRGFGDLPDALAWLRPFGIAGAASLEVPLERGSPGRRANTGTGATISQAGSGISVTTLHWGFALEYSTFYLTDRFTPGRRPKEEPLHQLVPLVEFAFDSPYRQKAAATMNPGLAYVEDVWQLSAETIVPLNRLGGRGLGFRGQLLIFLDDFAPSIFGKPLLPH